MRVSIIIPARNEAESLVTLLPRLLHSQPTAEIVVVNDGSTDKTRQVCEEHNVNVVNHVYSMGNGAAIKSGARHATGDIFVFMDADGQHAPENIQAMLDELDSGYDMVIGARARASHAGFARYVANTAYNRLASYMVGHPIADLTSGFRAVKSTIFKQFLYLLPNGFSYPTTITMALYRAGYSVRYIPIECAKRIGKSHISLLKDGIKFLLIILKVATLYSPLKLFFPVGCSFFMLGIFYYTYTYLEYGRFTNMGTLLFIISVLICLFGLLAEQLTVLMYSVKNDQQ